ncbi:MAG: glycosyltransferase family 9 protein [Pseudomonadota bacterium]
MNTYDLHKGTEGLEASFRRAVDLHRSGNLTEAEQAYRRILTIKPDLRVALHNLMALLRHQDRTEDLVSIYEKLLEIEDNDKIHGELALALLSIGRYEEAWAHYERRHTKSIPPKSIDVPEWTGESLSNKRLFVWHEQGFGDQIQISRYFSLLTDQGCDVVFACLTPLHRLLSNVCRPVDRTWEHLTEADYWINSMSIPFRFGTTASTIPNPVRIDIDTSNDGRIGILTRGSSGHVFDRYRSIPEGAEQSFIEATGAIDLSHICETSRDFYETAERISSFSLIVTVDTALAHLAASMRKPTWILLSTAKTDWRWGRGGTTSAWYPAARLLRQHKPDDWRGLLDATVHEAVTHLRRGIF